MILTPVPTTPSTSGPQPVPPRPSQSDPELATWGAHGLTFVTVKQELTRNDGQGAPKKTIREVGGLTKSGKIKPIVATTLDDAIAKAAQFSDSLGPLFARAGKPVFPAVGVLQAASGAYYLAKLNMVLEPYDCTIDPVFGRDIPATMSLVDVDPDVVGLRALVSAHNYITFPV